MSVWMVRAGKAGEREELDLKQSLVVLGWEEVSDLTPIQSPDQLKTLLQATYPTDSKFRLTIGLVSCGAFAL
jgi:restriction system protein